MVARFYIIFTQSIFNHEKECCNNFFVDDVNQIVGNANGNYTLSAKIFNGHPLYKQYLAHEEQIKDDGTVVNLFKWGILNLLISNTYNLIA